MLRYYISAALYLLSARTLYFSLFLDSLQSRTGLSSGTCTLSTLDATLSFSFARVLCLCVYVDIVVQKINGNEELS